LQKQLLKIGRMLMPWVTQACPTRVGGNQLGGKMQFTRGRRREREASITKMGKE
jgi:hypothetical protein